MANERSFTEKYGDATDLAVIVLELFMQVSTAASHSKRVSLLSRPGIPDETTSETLTICDKKERLETDSSGRPKLFVFQCSAHLALSVSLF